MKKILAVLSAMMFIAMVFFTPSAMSATTADVLFLVDESGSMSTEHAWLGNMVTSLNNDLVAASVTNNRYGLVGFGTSLHGGGTYQVPHTHIVGTGDWGTATELSASTAGLVVNGGTEDGWRAIDYAIDNYTYRPGAAKNFILVTDEDRDNTDASLSYAGILAALNGGPYMLNAVVDQYFYVGTQSALGVDADGYAYLADGAGGYTKTLGYTTGTSSNIYQQYVQLALATGGAAWNLNLLRAGGLTAQSFTEAFVDIKTEEIIITPTPEPLTLLLLGLGLAGLAGVRRKIQK